MDTSDFLSVGAGLTGVPHVFQIGFDPDFFNDYAGPLKDYLEHSNIMRLETGHSRPPNARNLRLTRDDNPITFSESNLTKCELRKRK